MRPAGATPAPNRTPHLRCAAGAVQVGAGDGPPAPLSAGRRASTGWTLAERGMEILGGETGVGVDGAHADT